MLGFGGAEIGYDRVPQATVSRLLESALGAGLNALDTAAAYLDHPERLRNVAAAR